MSQGKPALRFFLYVPRCVSSQSTVVVSVHGVTRNAIEHAVRFQDLAERYNAVLVAPYFCHEAFRGYQRLASRSGADAALLTVLSTVARLGGVSTQKVRLFGYSGGGQFVHRFTMFHPDRVARAVIASTGWYTFPDPALQFPLGIRAGTGTRVVDIDRFLDVPIDVIVGDRDILRDAALNKSEAIDASQGKTRLQRGSRWVEAIKKFAATQGKTPCVYFHTLPQGRHCFGQNVEKCGLGEFTFSSLLEHCSATSTLSRHVRLYAYG